MEFEHVQHTLDFFCHTEEVSRLISALCEHCSSLILGKTIRQSDRYVAKQDASNLDLDTTERCKPEASSYQEHVGSLESQDGVSVEDSGANSTAANDKDRIPEAIVKLALELEAILGGYLNQPTLVYPKIELLVSRPFDILRGFINLPRELQTRIVYSTYQDSCHHALVALEYLCYHIYNVAKVVGLRRVVVCAPNEVAYLSPVTSLTEWLKEKPIVTNEPRYESRRWCLEYVSLAWLSLLVYTPFDLATIWKDDENEITLQGRIIKAAGHFLNLSTKARDAAAIVLASLFTRPDVNDKEIGAFMSHCTRILTITNTRGEQTDGPAIQSRAKDATCSVDGTPNGDPDDIFDSSPKKERASSEPPTSDENLDHNKCPPTEDGPYFAFSPMFNDHGQIGVLTVLKQILKQMSRDDLSVHLPHIAKCLMNEKWNPISSACRKLKAACLGRLAVHLLPSTFSCQRYRRICRQLISSDTPVEEQPPIEYDLDIDERIERIIELLLISLVDNDIRVRWASAKSIGRISLKLPVEHNEEIVEHILGVIYRQYDARRSCFIKGEAPVHGGCLALAEIVRNGLLYPRMLNAVLECVVLTLGFDVWRGKGSEGTAVRDASCYICWAIVRNFTSTLLPPSSLLPMSKELVNMALFDISINCRRAAGAAIQEMVGRVGSIPHGLSIIVLADYYAVANRRHAFIDVSFEAAKLGFYTLSMIDNLMKTKLHHPDITTRRLAAVAVGKISLALIDAPNSQLITRNGRPVYLELLESCLQNATSSNLGVMHGSLCALVELLSGLLRHGELIVDHYKDLQLIPVIFEKKRLFRIKGGTLIRETIADLIKLICRIANMNRCLALEAESLHQYVAVMKDCMRNFTHDVEVAAAEALDDVFLSLYKVSPDLAEGLVNFMLKSMENKKDHVGARRGYALALGSAPVHLLPSLLEPVISTIAESLLSNYDVTEIKDAQTRQNLVISLVRVIDRGFDLSITPELTDLVIECLEFGSGDYEVDTRGDVGSWVREVSVEGIAYIWYMLHQSGAGCRRSILSGVNDSHLLRLVRSLVRVCLESMELTRARATLLLTHMFEPEFQFSVSWIWRRMFHGYVYEYDLASNAKVLEAQIDIKHMIDATMIAAGISPLNQVVAGTNEDSMSPDMDTESEYHMSVDSTPSGRAPAIAAIDHEKAVTLDDTSFCGTATISPGIKELLRSIASNINNSVRTSYNIEEMLDNIKSSEAATVDSLNKSQSNTSLRLPGYGVAPQCFEHLLWLLLLPPFFSTVVSSVIQILGGIPLQQQWKRKTVEDVVAKFLNENKHRVIQVDKTFFELHQLLMNYLIEYYRSGTQQRNNKLCLRVVSTTRILLSRGSVEYSPEFMQLLASESTTATNYNYLKCIIKCLQAHCAVAADPATSSSVLRVLVAFLKHQYPTLRFFSQSSLIVALNSCDAVYSRHVLDRALEVIVNSDLEEQRDCDIAIASLYDILKL